MFDKSGKVEFIATKNFPLVYLTIPKNACTTIKYAMHLIDGNEPLQNKKNIHRKINRTESSLIGWIREKNLISKLKEENFAFTLVRNPLHRIYSCYCDKIYNITPQSFQRIRNYLIENQFIDLPKWRVPKSNERSLENYRTNFKGFLRFVELSINGKTSIKNDPHWDTQSNIINAAKEYTFTLNFIGKVENIEQDLNKVLRQFSQEFSHEHPKLNKGEKQFKLEDILDNEILATITSIYKEDFKNYGYTIQP